MATAEEIKKELEKWAGKLDDPDLAEEFDGFNKTMQFSFPDIDYKLKMVFKDKTKDAYGHSKLGGFGDLVSEELKRHSSKYNNGKPIDVINQKLGYLVRCGDPDAIDSVVPMAYGNLALDLILKGIHGRLTVLKNGRYDNVPIEIVTSTKKFVNVEKYYNTERLRPLYKSFEMMPLFIMTSE